MKPFLTNLFMSISEANFNLKWMLSAQKKNNAGLMNCCIHTNMDDHGSRIWCDSSLISHASLAFSCCLPLPPLPFALLLPLRKRWVQRKAISEKEIRENGKKGKEYNMSWQQPHYCKSAAFWAQLGLPPALPSPALSAHFRQLPSSSACCFQLLLQRCEGSTEGQGVHVPYTQRNELCWNLPQGHEGQERKAESLQVTIFT